MLKMEIVMDKEKLINDGYDYTKAVAIICNGLKQAGFIEELNDSSNKECHIIYRGTNSNKDFAYFGLVYKKLVAQQWFKNVCKEWYLLNDSRTKNGEFLIAGNFIETAKEFGRW